MENRPLYSAEITELIGTPPRWIMRAGSGLLLGALATVVGLASVLRIPDQSVTPLVIKGDTQPYYLVQTASGQRRRLVASSKLVRRGQPLMCPGLDPDTATVRAPFAGTFYADGPAGARRAAGDTLGLLVPLTNAYRFSGQLELERVAELRRGRALRIQVPLAGQFGSLVLQGTLGYLKPTVRSGRVAYVGYLDSLSSATLARRLAPITRLEGRLLLSSNQKPVLRRLFE